jgi:hypothetical protein
MASKQALVKEKETVFWFCFCVCSSTSRRFISEKCACLHLGKQRERGRRSQTSSVKQKSAPFDLWRRQTSQDRFSSICFHRIRSRPFSNDPSSGRESSCRIDCAKSYLTRTLNDPKRTANQIEKRFGLIQLESRKGIDRTIDRTKGNDQVKCGPRTNPSAKSDGSGKTSQSQKISILDDWTTLPARRNSILFRALWPLSPCTLLHLRCSTKIGSIEDDLKCKRFGSKAAESAGASGQDETSSSATKRWEWRTFAFWLLFLLFFFFFYFYFFVVVLGRPA